MEEARIDAYLIAFKRRSFLGSQKRNYNDLTDINFIHCLFIKRETTRTD